MTGPRLIGNLIDRGYRSTWKTVIFQRLKRVIKKRGNRETELEYDSVERFGKRMANPQEVQLRYPLACARETHDSCRRIRASIVAAAVTLFIVGLSVGWAFPRGTLSPSREEQLEVISGLPISGNAISAQDNSCKRNSGAYIDHGLLGPVAIYCPEPACTTPMMRAHCEGVAVLWCVVSAKGKVTGVQVVKSLGDGFDENAMKTVRKWRFKPAMLNGKPVPAKTLVEVYFGTPRKAQKQGSSNK